MFAKILAKCKRKINVIYSNRYFESYYKNGKKSLCQLITSVYFVIFLCPSPQQVIWLICKTLDLIVAVFPSFPFKSTVSSHICISDDWHDSQSEVQCKHPSATQSQVSSTYTWAGYWLCSFTLQEENVTEEFVANLQLGLEEELLRTLWAIVDLVFLPVHGKDVLLQLIGLDEH